MEDHSDNGRVGNLHCKDQEPADELGLVEVVDAQKDSQAVAWNGKTPVLNDPEGIAVVEVDSADVARRRTMLAFPSLLSHLDSPASDVVEAPMNVESVRNRGHHTSYCMVDHRSAVDDATVAVESTPAVLAVLQTVVLLIAEASLVAPGSAVSHQVVWSHSLDKRILRVHNSYNSAFPHRISSSAFYRYDTPSSYDY